jgi:hypothetical protein
MIQQLGLYQVALNAVGSAFAAAARRREIESRGRLLNLQEALAYRTSVNNENAAAEASSVPVNDRLLNAARAISMARVVAAETGSALTARVSNIEAAKAEDVNRLDYNWRQARFSFLQDRENTRLSADLERQGLRNAGKASRASFLSDVLQSAGSAALGYAVQTSERERARGIRGGRQ